jgi:hypothetical protein
MLEMSEKLKTKLKEKGIDPERFIGTLSRYIGTGSQAFSSPQEYAQTIREKQLKGEPLQDPETARQFQSLLPGAAQGPGQTTFQFPMAGSPGQLPVMPAAMPEAAQSLINMVMRHQQAQPISIPYAPGTPTLATKQAEEAARQFDIVQDLQERQFAADEAYRQAQIALSRASAAARGGGGGGGGGGGTLTERDRIYLSEAGQGLIQTIRRNPHLTLSELRANIKSRQPELLHKGISPEAFLDFADEQYYLYHFLEAASRAGKDVEPWQYGQDIRDQPWLEKRYHPASKPPDTGQQTITRKDAEWYAQRSNGKYTADDILMAARTGQLDTVLKDILGGGSGNNINNIYDSYNIPRD